MITREQNYNLKGEAWPIVIEGGYFSFYNCYNVTLVDTQINFLFQPQFYSIYGKVFAMINCSYINFKKVRYHNNEQPSLLQDELNIKSYGGFIYTKNSTQISLSSVNAQNSMIAGDGGFGYIDGDFIISNSTLKNCYSSGSGGTFFIYASKSIVMSNVIIDGSESKLFGGGIFFQNDLKSMKFENVVIKNCRSQVGGGLIGEMSNHSNIQFKNNTALIYGNDHSPYLSDIKIISFGEFNIELGEEYVKRQMNYTQISYENSTYVQIDNLHNQQIYYLEFDLMIDNNSFSSKQRDLSRLTQHFISSSDNIIFQPVVDISTTNYFITFKVDQNYDQQLSTLLNFYNFSFQLNGLITKECFSGQVFKKEKQMCQYCSNFSYQPKDNSTPNSCKNCSQNIYQNCYSDISILNSGYYRDSEEGEISSCSLNASNCIGGRGFGDDLCDTGRVGKLCLECDLRNQRGQGIYSRKNFIKCRSCNDFDKNYLNLGIVVLICLLFFMLIVFLVEYQQRAILLQKFINTTQIAYLGSSYNRINYPAVYLKLLLLYLQIITICSFQPNNSIWDSALQFQVNLYNPLQPAFISLDCFLATLFPHFFSIPYLRVVIASLTPFILVLMFLLYRSIYSAVIYFKNKNKQIKDLKKNFTSHNDHENTQTTPRLANQNTLSTYATENSPRQEKCNFKKTFPKNSQFYMISFLLFFLMAIPVSDTLYSACLCRQLSNKNQYSIIDFTLSCSDNSRIMLLSFDIIPILVFLSIIFPLALLYKLSQNKQNLNDYRVQSQLGFLFLDYKTRYYYWEFIRFILRLSLILTVYSFYDNYTNIAIVCIVLLVFYSVILLVAKPHQVQWFNTLEIYAILSSLFMIIVYLIQYQQEELDNSLTILVYLANVNSLLFFSFLFIQLFKHSISLILIKLKMYPIREYSQNNQHNIKKFRIVRRLIRVQKSEEILQNSTSSLAFQSIEPLESYENEEKFDSNAEKFFTMNQQQE